MEFIDKLNKYARLIVRSGLNVQKDQIVCINANIEAVQLVRLVTKEAYNVGAKEVVVSFQDEEVKRLTFQNMSKEDISDIPTWLVEQKNTYAKKGACFLMIHSEDPSAYKDLDPAKLTAYSSNLNKLCDVYRSSLDRRVNRWCIVGASSPLWAKTVFPNLQEEEAVSALWEAIFKVAKIDDNDPVVNWDNHRESFQRRVKILNELNLDTLTYSNSLGTNFTVGLTDQYQFAGGGSKTVDNLNYFPNIPTEEIFTTPHKDKLDGIMKSSMPLVYSGNVIDDFYLEFKDGRITDYGAKQGYEVLKEIIETDEGSHHIGETALVPYDSPISNMNLLFYSTLYDENASCHIAIGKGFPKCFKNSADYTQEELFNNGVNHSLVHVDFMIGTSDLNIVGTTKDGKQVQIFKDGNFAF